MKPSYFLQEILYWQTRTIEMMYARVGEAIRAAGSQTHPTDWLLFMCPGMREFSQHESAVSVYLFICAETKDRDL